MAMDELAISSTRRQTFEEFVEERRAPIVSNSGLSDHHLDLWEHGCLLFQAFEWQAAADLFAHLSRSISLDLYSTICLLNSAMIQARLGEYSSAANALAEAEHVAELLPITLCLMGHVEYELGNFEKSKDCFNIAVQEFDEDHNYAHLGLDFALCEEQILLNLDVLESRYSPGMVGTIPGDVLFEAPPRDDDVLLSASPDDIARWNIDSVASLRSSSSISVTIPPRSGPPARDRRNEEVRGRGTRPYSLGASLISAPTVPEVLNRIASAASARKSRIKATYVKMRAIGKKALAQRPSNRRSPGPKLVIEPDVQIPEKRRPVMEPRDARPVGNGTGGLSEFIQNLSTQNKLEARDARGRPEPTGDLASFFRDTGPEYVPIATTLQVADGPRSSIGLGISKSTGLSDSLRKTTISGTASDITPQDRMSSPANKVETTPALPPSRADSSNSLDRALAMESEPKRPVSVSSDSSWRSQESRGPNQTMADGLRPQAIHPAMRFLFG